MERTGYPSYALTLSPEEAAAEQLRILNLIPPEHQGAYQQGQQLVWSAQYIGEVAMATPEQLAS
jgi:hypothetical protein